MATKATIKNIEDFSKGVQACGVDLKKVILFGSYARNKQTDDSDIDLALVADNFIGVPSEDIKLFLDVLRKYYMIQPQTYNTKDFVPDKDPFVKEILQTGVNIKL